MKLHYLLAYLNLIILSLACNGQSITPKSNPEKIVGGPFENGDFIFIGLPNNIIAIDTSPSWNENGQRIKITGRILKLDGITPAPETILYYYHTNEDGLYESKEDLGRKAIRHGYIRGWVKADINGYYTIYTTRPGTYPNGKEPAHIHLSVKELNIENAYYLDDLFFDDDPMLSSAKRKSMSNRGGSGVLRMLRDGDVLVAQHDIILGLNIPNYPSLNRQSAISSGREVGEDVISFTPYHAWGVDAGKKVCPVCKYGRYNGIIYCIGNNPNWNEIKTWLSYFESESLARKEYLKVYLVYSNQNESKQDMISRLQNIGQELNLEQVALTQVPSFEDQKSEVHFLKINPNVESTILIYKHSNIKNKYINYRPNKANFNTISSNLDKSHDVYFKLNPPHRQ